MADTIKIKAAVLTASDSRHPDDDLSGATLVALLLEMNAEVVERTIVPDDLSDIRNTLHSLAEREDVNLILTTGGTGFSPGITRPKRRVP